MLLCRCTHRFDAPTLLILLTLLSTLLPGAYAAPLLPRGSVNATAISVPIVVLSVFIFVGVLVACGGRAFRSRIASWCAGAALATGSVFPVTSQPTELTAEQLAGPSPNTPAPARSRRNRRARPNSVRSTRSLPVYMKEPGDDELVIFRGPEELEDSNIQATIVLPPVDELNEHTPDNSLDISRSRSPIYVPLPESAPETPLLETHDGLPEPNAATDNVDEATLVDERGEAPPYEVVPMDSPSSLDGPRADTPSTVHDDSAAPTPEPDHAGHGRTASGRITGLFARSDAANRAAHQREGSGRRFSGFFSRLTGAAHPAVPPVPQLALEERGHSRELSTPSTLSATSSRPSISSAQQPTHRASRSGSGSVLSLTSSMFRATSHPRSHLEVVTSPSTISLTSISAPLTHTAMRTEFTYPRGGPTPEQMKLISSRESFARFGVPYGRDAIAYSASRLDLSMPPPVFEEEAAGTSGTDSAEVASVNSAESAPTPAEAAEPASSSDEPALTHAEPDAGPSSAPSSPQAPLESSTQLPSAPKLLKPTLPPSSFRPAVTNPRSASRASSQAESFATAEESFHTASEPATPVMPSATLSLDVSDDALQLRAAAGTDSDALATPRAPSRIDHEQNPTSFIHSPLSMVP
ncbi:hypothetical protein BKA93DRAFT_356416 [Sparassis latifolia]